MAGGCRLGTVARRHGDQDRGGKIATAAGTDMVIATGKRLNPLRRSSEGARAPGSAPSGNPVTARKSWIAGQLEPAAALIVDDGARRRAPRGKSLLPAGVTRVEGRLRARRRGGDRARAGRRRARPRPRRLRLPRTPPASPGARRRRSSRNPRLCRPQRADPSRRHGGEGSGSGRGCEGRKRCLRRRASDQAQDVTAAMMAAHRPARRRGRRAAGARHDRAQKNAALSAMADAIEANAAGDPRRQRARHGRRAQGRAGALPSRPADARRRRASTAWPRACATSPTLPDPVGEVIAEWDRPNGLHIERVRTPLGVIGVIYESRPERDRRRRRAVPQGRQCRDPARRLGLGSFLRAPSMPAWSRA